MRRVDGVLPGRRLPRPPPAGRLAAAGQDDGHQPGLLGQDGVERGDLGVAGPVVDRRSRRCDHRCGGRGSKDQPGLEQGQVDLPTADVADGRGEQPRQQGGTQVGGVLGDRVGDPDHRRPRVVAGESEPVRGVVPDERDGQDLHVALVGEGGADRPADPLALGEAAARGQPWEGHRDRVVPLQAHDLLDQIGRPGQVGTPGRRDDQQRAVTDAVGPGEVNGGSGESDGVGAGVGDRAADLDQPSADDLRRIGTPAQPGRLAQREGDGPRRRTVIDVGHPGFGGGAGEFGEQAQGGTGRRWRERGVDAALEPAGCLGTELVAPGRAGHRDRVEVGGLNEDLGGVGGDLGGGATHDPGERHRPGVVGDDEVLRVEFAFDAVEGDQPLPLAGAAHHDRAGQFRPVEGVQRLPQPQHDQVRDVDRYRDGPHTRQGEPPGQPQRRGRVRPDPGDDPGDIPAAGGGVLHHDRVPRRTLSSSDLSSSGLFGRGLFGRGTGGVVEGQPERGRRLPGDPADGQAVAAVRSDGDVQHIVGEFQQPGDVGPHRGVRRQDEDAAVVVADAQLAGRADHPLAEMPVGLTGGDGETTGQYRAGQGHGHPVTDGEVERPADHLAGAGLGHPDPHPAHVLLLGLDELDREHLADDYAGEVVPDRLDGLHLETGPDERVGDRLRRRQGRDDLPQPRHHDLHDQFPVPNERPKRTSPSTKSRISWTSWRIIAARSRPIPNAKPL